jgi:hypothetical protein
LSENGTYQLLVKNEFGCYNLSDTLQVGNLTLDSKQINKDKILLFPNPAKESFKMEFLEYSPHTIQVLDLHGKELLEENIQSNQPRIQLSTHSLASGIYFIRTISPIGNTVHKLEVRG